MYDRLSATFVTVYVKEAHSTAWPIGSRIVVEPTLTTAQRCAVARRFQDAMQWRIPILIDPPETDAFEKLFAPWPVRFYVAHRGRLTHISEPIDGTFDIIELENHIGGAEGAEGAAAPTHPHTASGKE
jgi:hypothetical protein